MEAIILNSQDLDDDEIDAVIEDVQIMEDQIMRSTYVRGLTDVTKVDVVVEMVERGKIITHKSIVTKVKETIEKWFE